MPTPPRSFLASLLDDLDPPKNALARSSPLANALAAPLPPVPEHLRSNVLRALCQPQPQFDCWRREAAWIKTAGHVDAPTAVDHNGNVLYRNAKQGEFGCWHAAHIHADVLGGPDVWWNYRAQRSSDNLSEGAHLGNVLKNL